MADDVARPELEAVAGALRAWLPLLDAHLVSEGESGVAVWLRVRSAALMALGAIEDDLGVARTVPARRERRRQRKGKHGGTR